LLRNETVISQSPVEIHMAVKLTKASETATSTPKKTKVISINKIITCKYSVMPDSLFWGT
jgi:hypothetical protein